MNFEIIITQRFKREIKRLIKKFPSIKTEFTILTDLLEVNPVQGTSIGNDFYKIRLAISSKGKGKSGGARIITYALLLDEALYFLPFTINLKRKTSVIKNYNCSWIRCDHNC